MPAVREAAVPGTASQTNSALDVVLQNGGRRRIRNHKLVRRSCRAPLKPQGVFLVNDSETLFLLDLLLWSLESQHVLQL
jgi:hypothetical protein